MSERSYHGATSRSILHVKGNNVEKVLINISRLINDNIFQKWVNSYNSSHVMKQSWLEFKTKFFKYPLQFGSLLQNDISQCALGRKEGNVLFNDALNTFYLRLYGIGHMVDDHSDSEKGNPLPPNGLLFPIKSKGYFICNIPITG